MNRTRSGAIWGFILLIALAAATVQWLAVVPLADAAGPWPIVWPVVLTAGFLAAELFVVHLRLGREAYAFSLMEIPFVLGLFFVRPDLLIVCRLVGAAVAFLWQHKAPQKAAFNCAMFALETAGAVAIFNFVLQDASLLGPRAWLATGLATLFTSLLGSTLVSTAITLATGERPRTLSEVFSLGQLGDFANASFALIAVYILSADWRAAWLLGVVTAVLVVAYRSYEGARQRSESLEQVNRFTETVSRDVERDAVVRNVLVEVRAAFEVGLAQLRLTRAPQEVQDWVLEGTTAVQRTAHLIELLDEHTADGVLLVPRHPRSVETARLLGSEVRDCMVVPMRSEGRVVGSLAVADKLGDVATFTTADLRQLQALANHAAVAIDNAMRAHLIIRQAEEREHQAMHDDLTGLANRRLFGRWLDDALQRGRSSVLLLDLDRFREVNDTLGHEIGDRLLCLVADRLREAATTDAHVARFGGDEFAVLLPGADDLDARACASLVRAALARPFVLDGVAVAVDASVGVAVGEPGVDGVTVVRWADLAMYTAKETRSGLEVYRPELDLSDASRLGLLADLRTTVASNTIAVYYQPKVDVRTGMVEGVEALARWHHPEHGLIGPDEFIPMAEHSSLITPLTMLVLRTALADCERWQAVNGRFSVAVNISPRSLLDPGFVDEIARALAVVAVPASALTLEITETSLMTDPEGAIAALERLRTIGVRLSVDDLGTGYSSLAYLQRLPVDEIKIDRSFLAGIADASTQAVVGAIIDLGHRLGRRVVAEGIEDAKAFALLRDLDCDSAQGFWLGRPMPAPQLSSFLTEHAGRGGGFLRRVK